MLCHSRGWECPWLSATDSILETWYFVETWRPHSGEFMTLEASFTTYHRPRPSLARQIGFLDTHKGCGVELHSSVAAEAAAATAAAGVGGRCFPKYVDSLATAAGGDRFPIPMNRSRSPCP